MDSKKRNIVIAIVHPRTYVYIMERRITIYKIYCEFLVGPAKAPERENASLEKK